eukprot:361775-Chlamydomonas_euryale.AAC.20
MVAIVERIVRYSGLLHMNAWEGQGRGGKDGVGMDQEQGGAQALTAGWMETVAGVRGRTIDGVNARSGQYIRLIISTSRHSAWQHVRHSGQASITPL